MTLSNALRSATSALAGNATRASVLSRNISGVGDPNYVRREAVVSTNYFGTIKVDVQRNINRTLYNSAVTSKAEAANANVISAGLNRLAFSQGIDGFTNSPASLLGSLRDSINLAIAAPSDNGVLSTMIDRGRVLSSALNQSYSDVLNQRANVDAAISTSVEKLNNLLSQLQTINETIVQGTLRNEDVIDSMDVRDNIIDQMSSEINISVISQENNGVILTVGKGLLIFEKVPRSITFTPTPSYGPNTVGGSLIIDGVPANGENLSFPSITGNIGGNFKLRDDVLLKQQRQLDEIARTLIEQFAEEDQSVGGVKPKQTGLFSWSGGPSIPVSGTIEPGIASTIRINALIDPQAGGDPKLIRDGAINGDPDYIYNVSGGAGFSDRFIALSDAFETTVTFGNEAGLPTSQSLTQYAAASLDWLNSTRTASLNSNSYHGELSLQYTSAYQADTGTNLDNEMSKLLEVERAYQASAKLLSIIDEMFDTLFNSVRV